MGRPRYAKQPNDYGCGPTALLNLLKWSGARVTLRKHYFYLEKLCQTHDRDDPSYNGTIAQHFNYAVNRMAPKRYSVEHKVTITEKQIRRHLLKGGAVVLLHRNELGKHYSLLIGMSGEAYIAVNAFEDMQALHGVNSMGMKYWLGDQDDMPQAWLITRYTVRKNARTQDRDKTKSSRKTDDRSQHRGSSGRQAAQRNQET